MGHTTYTGKFGWGPLFHYILPALPPTLDILSVLKGGDTDKDCVSQAQGHQLAASVIILHVMLCFFLSENVGLLILINMIP